VSWSTRSFGGFARFSECVTPTFFDLIAVSFVVLSDFLIGTANSRDLLEFSLDFRQILAWFSEIRLLIALIIVRKVSAEYS
jgi:hypothetical protein